MGDVGRRLDERRNGERQPVAAGAQAGVAYPRALDSRRVRVRNRTAMNSRETREVRFAIPMLVCSDAASEIEFCKKAFGAAEVARRVAPDGRVVHARPPNGCQLHGPE